MAAFKNKDNGTWYVQFRYTDWRGERQQKLKRGFATKKEALAWEREFLMEKQADVNMTFESFVSLYEKDIKPKLKLNTWLTKESIIKKKILPYFAKRKLSEITAKDIIDWQNEIRNLTDCHGKPLSKTYLKTVHNQLSAIFNHAIRYYGLQVNPAQRAGNMGTEERREMLFWTREEYTKFSEAMMDKPLSFYAFEMLYWCGIREGELLALTPADFDFEKHTVSMGLMIKYVDFLNAWNAEEAVDFSIVEDFWAEQVREYFRNQPFVLTADTSKTIGANLDDLFEQAKKRQKQNAGTQYLGTVLQHLVAAKLCLILPEGSFEIHGASVADGPTDRNGDFVIGNTVIHCTTMPGALLIEKCKANLRAGCHPVIITIFERVHTALNLAEDAGLAGRVEVWDIQQFLSANVYEHSLFDESKRNSTLSGIIDRYNKIVLEAETDPSLRIEFEAR